MTMNISILPLVPKGETRHSMRNQEGAAEFDVKTLLKNHVAGKSPGQLETVIDEEPQPEADEELSSDGGETSPIDLHQSLTPQQLQPLARSQTESPPAVSTFNSSPMPALNSAPMPALNLSPKPASNSSPVPALNSAPMPELNLSPKPASNSSPMPALNSAPMPALNSSPMPALNSAPMPALNPSPMQALTSAPEAAVKGPTRLQAPSEQLPYKDGRGPVEQIAVKAHANTAASNTPAIADALSKMQRVEQISAIQMSGSVPKHRAIPVHSVAAVSGQFPQSVTILPPVGPNARALSKNDLISLNEVADQLETEPTKTVKLGSSLETAKVRSIGDQLNAHTFPHQLSAGNVQTAGAEFSALVATPERQVIDAIDDEVSALGARLKAQAALAAQNPDSGKLPMLSQIKVDLNPGSLGAVRIEIAMSASGEVELNLLTAKETTATMIERSREEVLGGLQSRAVEVRGFTVNTAEMASSTQPASHQEGSAARFSGHGEGQQARHLPNGRGEGHGNGTRPEETPSEGETTQQAMRNSGSGIYI